MPARKLPQEPLPEAPATADEKPLPQLRRLYPQSSASFALVYEDVTITYTMYDAPANVVEAQLISLLKRGGYSVRSKPVAQAPSSVPSRDSAATPSIVDPWYNSRGEPCCPTHKRILNEGRFGHYCSALARKGEAMNAKGYCALRFTEGEDTLDWE